MDDDVTYDDAAAAAAVAAKLAALDELERTTGLPELLASDLLSPIGEAVAALEPPAKRVAQREREETLAEIARKDRDLRALDDAEADRWYNEYRAHHPDYDTTFPPGETHDDLALLGLERIRIPGGASMVMAIDVGAPRPLREDVPEHLHYWLEPETAEDYWPETEHLRPEQTCWPEHWPEPEPERTGDSMFRTG